MSRQRGFSFLELAIFLLILTVLLGGVLTPMATQVQMRKIKETERLLEDAKEALYGYAMTHGRLPCPDSDGNGLENSCASGQVSEGFLPWNDLQTVTSDAWGRLFHYVVTNEFTITEVNPACTTGDGDLDLCDLGNLNILRNRASGIYLIGGAGGTGVFGAPAIVISVGPNGLGGTDVYGNKLPDAPVNAADEAENSLGGGANNVFSARPYFSNAPATCNDSSDNICNFDDLVVWISAPVLFNRMVMAGQLP